jgi:hypothetical protein
MQVHAYNVWHINCNCAITVTQIAGPIYFFNIQTDGKRVKRFSRLTKMLQMLNLQNKQFLNFVAVITTLNWLRMEYNCGLRW